MRRLAQAVWVVSVVLPACSGGEGEDGALPVAAGAGGARACEGPGYAESDVPAQDVDAFSVTFVDAAGDGVPGIGALVCGLDACSRLLTSDPAGALTATGLSLSMQKPALKFDARRIDYAETVRLLSPGATHDLGPLRVFPLELATAGGPLEPGVTNVAGEVTLSLEADTVIDLDRFVFVTESEQLLRATLIDPGEADGSIPGALDFDLLVALGPAETELCPPGALSLPNLPELPAGAAVEFHLHGTDIGEPWAPYGGWGKVSDGRVGDDGTRIETLPGEGIPQLAVVGVRTAG